VLRLRQKTAQLTVPILIVTIFRLCSPDPLGLGRITESEKI